ncbi:MAG TPA: hypothetical protein VK184_16615 [Nostocaceae cyanobacterium]|nr:hypothetical protein [Nostocaceae cyanobacterium]
MFKHYLLSPNQKSLLKIQRRRRFYWTFNYTFPNLLTINYKILLFIILSIFSGLVISPVSAQNLPRPSRKPLELDLLIQPDKSVTTANTINLQGLTIPSLWWTKASAENKLLDNWIAYPPTDQEPGRVDVIVNQQIWSLLDYLERYDFVNRVGSLTTKTGYNVRVFNYQQEYLAAYTCDFNLSPVVCNISMNRQGRGGLRYTSEN